MRSQISLEWKCPSFTEYSRLWSFTDWPVISAEKYVRYVAVDENVVSARDSKNKLIGFARIISDWCQYAYVQDVIVDPSRRKEGVATKMLNHIVKDIRLQNVHFLALFSTKDGESLYRKIGFETPVHTVPLFFNPNA